MTLPAGEIVEVDSLLKTIGAALIAGVGIALIFSMAILGLARAEEARRDGRALAASAWTAVAVLGMAATLGVVVLGLIVMTEK